MDTPLRVTVTLDASDRAHAASLLRAVAVAVREHPDAGPDTVIRTGDGHGGRAWTHVAPVRQ